VSGGVRGAFSNVRARSFLQQSGAQHPVVPTLERVGAGIFCGPMMSERFRGCPRETSTACGPGVTPPHGFTLVACDAYKTDPISRSRHLGKQ